ncbi:three-helix bundle dimerization domain-containing protein [Streptomyces shenzhenensis]|uniref:three-helix bundle dimerization domain-containing protein n=1 Tax=Streptomyces shenzhenensis TaxID=943815 RepID=UPI001F1EC071|nr:hypothetical protein [Streptomyces shenzhenensis]
MTIDLDEDAAIRRVTEHLKTAYHDRRTPDEIEVAITEARECFTALPVRTYVPILVERRARQFLSQSAG